MNGTSERDRPERDRLAQVAAAALIGALAVIAARCAYFRMFGQFADYDDEGYIIRSIRSYLEGRRLYEDVFSQYGPAFYLIEQVLHGALRLPLDHDTVRLITIGFWLLATIGSAAIVFRLTASVVASAFAFVTLFNHLVPLINEPGHPQSLLMVLATVVCLLATGRERPPVPRAAWCGVVIALSALTKVNVGALLFLGIALPLALGLRLPGAASGIVVVLAAVVPFALFKTHVAAWAFPFAAVSSASIAAASLACRRRLAGTIPDGRALSTLAVSTALSSLVLILPALMRGTSPASLVRAIVIDPSRFASVFFLPFSIPWIAVAIGVVSIALSIVLPADRLRDTPAARAVVALIKLTMVFGVIPTGWWGYSDHIAYLAPFAWVILIDGSRSSDPASAFPRSVLALCGVFQILQAYPVAGSQLSLATAFIVVVAFVGLGDIIREIDGFVAAPGRVFARIALAAGMAPLYWPAVAPGAWSESYRQGFALRMPGANRLHVSHDQVSRAHLIAATAAAECTSLVTIPGQYSVNEWSGVPTPNARNVTAWLILLRRDEQHEMWSALRSSANPCVLFSPKLAGLSSETSAVQNYLASNYRVAAAVRDDEFLVPADADASRFALLRLIAGRQAFARTRPALPVSAELLFLHAQPDSTIRVWFRTSHSGVVLGCQSGASVEGRAARALPMMYVGRSGSLYAQHYVGEAAVQKSTRPVNDGKWHHAALVRQRGSQSLYVDGTPMDSLERTIVDLNLTHCQAGIGMTTEWPDAGHGWMTFTGEIDDLAVTPRAWTAKEIAQDWLETLARH